MSSQMTINELLEKLDRLEQLLIAVTRSTRLGDV